MKELLWILPGLLFGWAAVRRAEALVIWARRRSPRSDPESNADLDALFVAGVESDWQPKRCGKISISNQGAARPMETNPPTSGG